MTGYTVAVERLTEYPGAGRLGRHVWHDSRNRAYAWPAQRSRAGADVLHARHGPILDQGARSSCTGNAEVGALATGPVFRGLPPVHPQLDEALAVTIYSDATRLDAFTGSYPPEDTGSDGGSACKAALSRGLISGYRWAFGTDQVLAALAGGPVMLGVNWYDSMDAPGPGGLVTVSARAQLRGGHEFVARGDSPSRRQIRCDNSWGTGWGDRGSFSLSYSDLARLLGENGDAVIPVPATAPAPVPVPVTPAGPDAAYWADARLLDWAGRPHVGANAYAARAYAERRAAHTT